MRLTSFTDFGLRALMRLAGEPDRTFTTEQIASEFALSRHHLIKIVRDLAEAEIVRTQRGVTGGFALARDPETITIGEIVRRLESREALVECFRGDGGTCVLTPTCRLKGRLRSALDAFLRELDRATLADCVWQPPGSAKAGREALPAPRSRSKQV